MDKVILLYNDYLEIYSRTETSPGELIEAFSAMKAIKDSLESLGYDVIPISVTKLNMELLSLLKKHKKTLVFNLCESLEGNAELEKTLPDFMEKHGIVYTGSGPEAIEGCLNKFRVKKTFKNNGIPTPSGALIKGTVKASSFKGLRFPLILKPVHEDASIGIASASVVYNEAEAIVRANFIIHELRQPAVAEEYIEGREVTASVWGNNPPSMIELSEIDFAELPTDLPKIVTYNSKWNTDSPEYIGTKPVCPAIVTPELRARLQEIAINTFKTLKLRDYGRVDMRVTSNGEPYVIDVNPNPDLSPDAGFFRAASSKGFDYIRMIDRIVTHAKSRGEAAAAKEERESIAIPAAMQTAEG
ncbi:MAG: ATP-grasp domain-containing protein [Myxococcota bacterium]|jgi:D-alanine-D-alanine ligase